MATTPAPNRGEVWLVNFDPAVGGEIRKLRLALVVTLETVTSPEIEAVASAVALCVGA